MHSIRAQARRAAWDTGPLASSSYNPFARSRSNQSNFVDTEAAQESELGVNSGNEHLPQRHPKDSHEAIETSEGALCTAASEQKASETGSVTAPSKDSRGEVSRRRRDQFPPITATSQLKTIFFNSWAHTLLLFIPAGFVVQYTHRNFISIFCVNFIAMIPSIMILSMAVDEVILRVGETIGALLSATFSNAALLITSILLLRSRQVTILQVSLIGAILSNLLLMTGLGFFLGGLNRIEQFFNVTVAQSISEMLLLAVLSLVVPTAAQALAGTDTAGIVRQSRGTSVVLLFTYGLYLFFQLKSHAELYNMPSQKVAKRNSGKVKEGEALRRIAMVGASTAASSGIPYVQPRIQWDDEEDEVEIPELTIWVALATLVVSTTTLTFNTLFATDSINGLLQEVHISETFLALVILPLLGNDPTTLVVAVKDKLDLTIALTLGKCVQTALLVVPFIVILGWIMGVDTMTLNFGSFETVIMFASIIVVNYIIQDGKSNWLVGALLISAYVIVSIAAFFIH